MQQKELSTQLQEIKSLLEKQKNKPLTLVDAAEYLSISQSHLYKLTSQRKIPFHKPSGKYLYFYEHELDEWIKEERNQPSNKMAGKNSEDSKQNEDEQEEEPP